MEKKLFLWEISDFIFISIFGTLLHFFYEWSSENKIVGLFSATNESTWEHLKLLFFPVLVFTIIQYFIVGNKFKGFLFTKAIATLLGMLTIVTLYYTYKGVIGKEFLIIDIIIFLLGAAVIALFSFFRLPYGKGKNLTGAFIFIIITSLFILFTFNPPQIALFEQPDSLEK